MHDENGNQYDELSTIANENSSGINTRNIKRSKSVNLGSSRIANLHVSKEIGGNESPLYLSCSPRFIVASPCGSFGQLPTELIYLLLKYLPLDTIGQLGQTSKSIRDVLIRWTGTTRMHDRLVESALNFDVKHQRPIGGKKVVVPHDLNKECQRTGVLIKQLTYLFPSSQRLGLFYQLTNEVKTAILHRNPEYETSVIVAMTGLILHSLISGWDRAECSQVFSCLCQWNGIGTLTTEFIKCPVSSNGNVERFLRVYLRSLFLDYCSPADRSLWYGIVFDGAELSSHAHQAKLLLLLCAPLDSRDGILWDFAEEDADFNSYVAEYKAIAETVGYLVLPSRRFYSAEEIVDLIETVTRLPTQWSTRAIASFLLCLHCCDSQTVLVYFKYLASKDDMLLVINILTDIFYVASDFVHSASSEKENVVVTNRSLLHLIRNAINCGWNHDDRRTIVDEMWSEIRELASNLLDEAMLIGNTDELHSLMQTWKEICVQLTF